MSFDIDKKNALKKKDKSSKGTIDHLVKPLCDLINGFNDYYTTSSCAGRVVLLKTADSGKKTEAQWLYTSHQIAKYEDVLKALAKPPADTVWIKFEPVILHIACRDIQKAEKLLFLLRTAGFKRSGIISTDKIIIELFGTERIDAPVSQEGKLLVSSEYLGLLVNEANKKMIKNEEKIDHLFKQLLTFKST